MAKYPAGQARQPNEDQPADRSTIVGDSEIAGANPFAAPLSYHVAPPDDLRSRDQSVTAEPWLQTVAFTPLAGDLPAAIEAGSASGKNAILTVADLAEHSVWDEPTTSAALVSDQDPNAITWYGYYLFKASQTSAAKTWWVTCGIVLLAGPLAILGALFNGYSGTGLVMVVLMGPTVEEILKLALPLWVIEKRPWLFSQGGQILVCAFAGGMAFAIIENWVYLNIYVPNPSDLLIVWRWTVCVLLHVSCSLIAGIGLIRVRQQMHATRNRPQLFHGARWVVAAIVLHGSYNLLAVFLNDLF